MSQKPINYLSNIKYEYRLETSIQKDSTIYVSSIGVLPVIYVDKISSKKYAKPGDIIDYTIIAQNRGNTKFEQVSLYDNFPRGISYIDKSISVTVDGKELEYNLDYTIKVDKILRTINIVIDKEIYVGEIILATFNTKIDINVSSNILKNEVRMGYVYMDIERVIVDAKSKKVEDAYLLTYIE